MKTYDVELDFLGVDHDDLLPALLNQECRNLNY